MARECLNLDKFIDSSQTEEERMDYVEPLGVCRICNETIRYNESTKVVPGIGEVHWWHSKGRQKLVTVTLKTMPYGYISKRFLSFVPRAWNETEIQKRYEEIYGDNLLEIDF